MDVEKFDYDKTLLKMKLVYEGVESDKRFSMIKLTILFIAGLFISYETNQTILNDVNSDFTDYLMAFCLPLLIIGAILQLSIDVYNRDRLKEIPMKGSRKESIQLLNIASKKMNWTQEVVSENYLIFITKNSFRHDMQYITLIFTPDNKIYFNSINSNDYYKIARFKYNYDELLNELKKLETEFGIK